MSWRLPSSGSRLLTRRCASLRIRDTKCHGLRHWAGSNAAQRRSISTSDLSYVEGPTDPPLLHHTIPEHFATIVSQYGDLPAVMARDPVMMDAKPPPTASAAKKSTKKSKVKTTTLTFAELDSLSDSVARALQGLGVHKGQRVAVSLGSVWESVVLTYAITKLGTIWVPLNPTFNSEQLSAALSHLGVRTLIIGAVTDLPFKPGRGRSNLDLLSSLIPGLTSGAYRVESPVVPSLENVIVVDNTASHPQSGFPPLEDMAALTSFTDLLSCPPTPVKPDRPLSADETINIQFTSGTTSTPKAAMLSHRGILNNGHLIGSRMGLVPGDLIVVPPPLFHCFGCVLGLMATATTGAAILLPSPAFDPAATLHMVSEKRAHGLYGVATMFVAELDLLQNPAFSSTLEQNAFKNLTKGIASGSSVPESLMLKLFEKMGLKDLTICYGMTETSPVSCMVTPYDTFAQRTSTVGRVMPHTAVKIVSPTDRSVILPRGECGELAASGYLVMKGYYEDPVRTALDRIQDPVDGKIWMYSGDEARIDEDGFVQITGRIKDLIIRGGENIHPAEVENCLFQLEGVKEVSVVGVPDEKLGEAVAAFVVPRQGVTLVGGDGGVKDGVTVAEGGTMGVEGKELRKEVIQNWVRTKLSKHLVPKYVFTIDEYPKTASGKIQKFRLRDQAREILGLKGSASRVLTGKGVQSQKIVVA
ncbi:hypothetical protein F5Y18DRAFT_294260 [Xylariaceae sp. FL1019]|nr:hypothetical protein F5Y18DRAFT_294260 [Xylariaceae sp. FL1019]